MTGTIRFDSNPVNSEVYINNKLIGQTPLDITDVEPGNYLYTISHNNQQYSNKLTVHDNKITHISADLTTNTKTEEYLDLDIKSIKSTENSYKNIQSNQASQSFKDPFIKTKDKSTFFNTGHVTISTSSQSPPGNVDDYSSIQNVYALNSQNPIEVMTLINHGPGNLFYILRDKYQKFTRTEEILHPTESRILYNVYELRLRTNIPLTEYHLVEGRILEGGASIPQRIYTEIRPILQPNETLKVFSVNFDNHPANITINVPALQVIPADYSLSAQFTPLLPGQTATLTDNSTGLPMPYTIPQGFVLEAFALYANFTTQTTGRNYFELVPGSGTYSLTNAFPFSARGNAINQDLNISFFSSEGVDPLGAPAAGRNILVTITNDDAVNSAIGDMEFIVILRQLS